MKPAISIRPEIHLSEVQMSKKCTISSYREDHTVFHKYGYFQKNSILDI